MLIYGHKWNQDTRVANIHALTHWQVYFHINLLQNSYVTSTFLPLTERNFVPETLTWNIYTMCNIKPAEYMKHFPNILFAKDGPNDEGNTHLWNVGLLQWDYTELHRRILPSSGCKLRVGVHYFSLTSTSYSSLSFNTRTVLNSRILGRS
jgi:hypothetical protein